MTSKIKVEYKTKLPDVKLPYYRLTVYMQELAGQEDSFDSSELMSWFKWISGKGIPCAIAMGAETGSYGQLAVWVWGREHNESRDLENVETMGRIVFSHDWPHGVLNHNMEVLHG
jgi:hypothetical protein